jgi:DNA-binding transcriptional ArsR family regulator
MDDWDVLAEPRRRRLLATCLGAERSVAELHATMPDVTLGAVSQHLARLRAAGLVRVRADGRRRFYRADPHRLAEVRRGLDAMWVASLDQLAALAADAERAATADPATADPATEETAP